MYHLHDIYIYRERYVYIHKYTYEIVYMIYTVHNDVYICMNLYMYIHTYVLNMMYRHYTIMYDIYEIICTLYAYIHDTLLYRKQDLTIICIYIYISCL